MKYDSILGAIGNTPLVKLSGLAPAGVNVYVKLESFNPMGSVKDRMALAVIEAAERSGELKPGQTVIEATSGNTGIGLAMVCARRGYPLVIVMAENFSVERRKMLRFLGAKVVLTPASEMGTGMLNKAIELAETHGWYLCRQFENEANASLKTRPMPRCTPAPRHRRFWPISTANHWTTSSPASVPVARCWGWPGVLGRRARVPGSSQPSRTTLRCSAAVSPSLGQPTASLREAILASDHTRCRAGAPTSSRA